MLSFLSLRFGIFFRRPALCGKSVSNVPGTRDVSYGRRFEIFTKRQCAKRFFFDFSFKTFRASHCRNIYIPPSCLWEQLLTYPPPKRTEAAENPGALRSLRKGKRLSPHFASFLNIGAAPVRKRLFGSSSREKHSPSLASFLRSRDAVKYTCPHPIFFIGTYSLPKIQAFFK